MVKGSIGLGLTVKAGKENNSKDVTFDSYITVENPGDESLGAAQTCDIIVSVMESSATDITKYLLAKKKGLDGIEGLEERYEQAKRDATAVHFNVKRSALHHYSVDWKKLLVGEETADDPDEPPPERPACSAPPRRR